MIDGFAKPNQLALAVSGLSGLAGVFLMPMLMEWLRFLLGWAEIRRSALGRPQGPSGLGLLRAIVYTVAFWFFVLARSRAANELRTLRVESSLFAPTVTSFFVGMVFWAFFAVAFGTLFVDWQRYRQSRRVGRIP